MKKWGLYCIWLLVLMITLTGCGSGNNNSANSASNSAAAPMEDSKASTEATADQASSSEEAPVSAAKEDSDGGSSQDSNTSTTTAIEVNDTSVGFTGNDVVAGLNKKLIYRANLTMEVKDYAKAQSEVRNMITLAQGYIIGFTENMSKAEQGGTFILKVPASGFSSFLNNLEKVKNESLQRNIEGQDVSEEYVDLGSRLKAKQLMEAQYIEFMKKATKSNDLVAFANELGSIQESIEQIKGRMRYIDQNVSFSTVELRLYQTDEVIALQKEKEQGPLLDRASDALNGSLKVISTMFQWLVIILAAALPILLAGIVILAIVLWYRKTGRNRQRPLKEQNRNVSVTNRVQAKEQPDADDKL
ncbi:DUF4349 domain-containing protein [Paenibacillus wynnii]|uniref:DUF4349 domain-containing protein n=1 Tax=Paenibacillus wynnii TaxID=268407 RepID=UPI0027938242|nr:DUF4349 domain-containing protein [Paenibacillus wynnii]MDQ0196121.1 hypothetical protein [Paenibacillus wynnii]